LAEWKEIRKKSQVVAKKAAVITNEGHWPILEKEFLASRLDEKNSPLFFPCLFSEMQIKQYMV
jgi:hypothetical protein